MYTNRIINDKLFQNRFYSLKEDPNPKEIFKLIKDYSLSMEANSLGEINTVQFRNPLDVDKEVRSFVKDLNSYCLDFLIKMASTVSNKKFSSEAQTFLGMVYEIGLFDIPRNIKFAFNYYVVAAKQNNKYGTYRLAQAYEKEMGKSNGYSKAIYFYRCAAKLGCVYGMHTYGSILLSGDLNTTKEFQTGLFYLKLASHKADRSYPFPFYDLGQVYESDYNSTEIDPDDEYAFKMYERGARLGCPNSQYRLGKAFELGQLSKKPCMRLALEYYKDASDNGHMDAQYLLSKFFFTGVDHTLSANFDQSFKYALLCGIRGHPEGAFTVAEFYEKGYGRRRNNLLSLWWYTISFKFGNTNSDVKINKLKSTVYKKNIGPSHQPKNFCCFC
ncbi:TPR repeat protein [Vairimorpha necatrix]|uniref:TPR repeat protein n=1 Tax=Vairimorpha necatrix TaxID=6039 RepID=A0AAX4JF63_9MICR